jgi:hypothetical protein
MNKILTLRMTFQQVYDSKHQAVDECSNQSPDSSYSEQQRMNNELMKPWSPSRGVTVS